jgi:hypothetical protein
MPTIVFPGGLSGDGQEVFIGQDYYVIQRNVAFPLPADGVRRNLDNNYVVRINSVDPEGFSQAFSGLAYNGNNYSGGGILTFSSLTFGFCEIVANTNFSDLLINLSSSGLPGAELWNEYGLQGTFDRAIAGSWSWNTVPTAPSITTLLNGTNVTVTRGTSTSDNLGPITGYRVQRRESNDGSTWGSWGNIVTLSTSTFSHTYTDLTPAKYYQFRVYAVNNAGNSEASTSGTVFITPMARHTETGFFTALTNLKRYDGSSWQNVTQAKRWNGTSWVTVDITGINSI